MRDRYGSMVAYRRGTNVEGGSDAQSRGGDRATDRTATRDAARTEVPESPDVKS